MSKSKSRGTTGGSLDQQTSFNIRPLFQSAFELQKANRFSETERIYHRVLALHPYHADSFGMLGFLAHQTGRDEQAVTLIQKAININPQFAPYHSNLAHALIELGRREEAKRRFERAIKLDAKFHEARIGLSILLRENGDVDASIKHLRAVVAASPDNGMAHANLGYGLLIRGDMSEGWKEMEWRFWVPNSEGRDLRFPQPKWSGETGGKQTLLIHAEQGLGDTIQFCRYASLAVDRGTRVILEVQRPLVRLLESLRGDLAVVARGDLLPSFDYQIPLMSLPTVFETTLATVPNHTPYLKPNQAQVARVRTHYSHQMTAAARLMAPMKLLMLRSKRVAMRRQSLKRQNMRSMTLRCL